MGNFINIVMKIFFEKSLFDLLNKKYYREEQYKKLNDSHVIYLLFVGFLHEDKLTKENNGKYILKFGKTENFTQRLKSHKKTFSSTCNILYIGQTISATKVEKHIKKQMRLQNKLIKLNGYGTELLLINTKAEFISIKKFIEKSIAEIKSKQHKQIEKISIFNIFNILNRFLF